MAWGALPMQQADGGLAGGLPGPEIWAGTSRPLFVVAGADDNVTKPEEIAVIRKALGRELEIGEKGHILDEVLPQASAAPPELEAPQQDVTESPTRGECNGATASSRSAMIARDNSSSFDSRRKKRLILKTSILPSPATHALLYDQACYRTLAGLIQTFLADHIDMRLSLGWQLQYLCKGGKWDVKNLAKWQAVKPVSEPIHAVFRAMKTLREVDESHSPAVFVKDWKDKIKAVVDISHESPVYNPEGLENGGIEYHKFPTVSKIPPTREEVASFISLVDRLRLGPEGKESDKRLIGVHCHYGFNRTGFFICSYLVERQGFTVQQAIDEFQKQRPPGIRHDHFLDTLFVRYCIGLKRAPTF
jgi:protein-tyrosine phosphatase